MTYNEIINLALAYSDREDNTEISNKMAKFIKMVEARLNRVLQTLDMSSRAYTVMVEDQERYGLPTDFLSIRSIRIVDADTGVARKTLQYVNPEQMANLYDNGDTSGYYYTIVSNSLHIKPTHNSDYKLEVDYYKKLTALTSTNTTNWISTTHPDCYVFGLMVEINAYVKDKETAALWEDRYKTAISEITALNEQATWSGTALHTRVG